MILNSQIWKAQSPEKARVILLHGMGGTGALWRPIAARLEQNYSVLAPDQRGHGASQDTGEKDPKFDPKHYAKDLLETTQRHQWGPSFVVGHSMGVRTACAFAQAAPDQVRGLALVDLGLSAPKAGGFGEKLAAFLRVLPESFESRTAAKTYMDANCPDQSVAQYLLAVARLAPSGGAGSFSFPFSKPALIATLESVRGISVAPWIRHFAKTTGRPVQVYRGELSQAWSHDEFLKDKNLFRDCPGMEFIEVEGASHGLPFEKRDMFIAHLLRMINPN